MQRFIVLCAVAVASGCASQHAAIGPRVTLGYTDRGHLFAVQLRDAAPARGPSSGAHALAARLGGNVCGTDIAYDAIHMGRFMSVSGFATNIHSTGDQLSIVVVNTTTGETAFVSGQGDQRPVALEVRDVADRASGAAVRVIRGTIGEAGGATDPLAMHLMRTPSAHEVDLQLGRDRLSGDVGLRHVDLRRSDDDFIGHVEIYSRKVPFVIRGADELWCMPAAAQAAILPLVLTCTAEARLVQRVDLRN